MTSTTCVVLGESGRWRHPQWLQVMHRSRGPGCPQVLAWEQELATVVCTAVEAAEWELGLVACRGKAIGASCKPAWQCRPVAGVMAGSSPTSSSEDLDCWYAFLQLQRLTMSMCVVVEINVRMQSQCCAGTQLQGLPAWVLCWAGHCYHSCSLLIPVSSALVPCS